VNVVRDSAELYQALARSYGVFRGEQPLPGAGALRQAAVTPVFCDRGEAQSLADELARSDPEQFTVIHVVEVGDPLVFMRRVAGWGIGGLVCQSAQDREQLGVLGFTFMTRVEEAGRELPTVLTAQIANGIGPSLTRLGPRELPHDALIHWVRYDIMDRLSASWGKASPFREWNPGDPFFEIRSPYSLVRIMEVELLGQWLSVDGAVPFFTSTTAAEECLHRELRTGRTRHAIDFADSALAHDYHTAGKCQDSELGWAVSGSLW
jgi:hypothetical protein